MREAELRQGTRLRVVQDRKHVPLHSVVRAIPNMNRPEDEQRNSTPDIGQDYRNLCILMSDLGL